MSKEKFWFLKVVKEQVVVECYKLQYEIPDVYFEKKENSISTDLHGKVDTLGFLNLLVYADEKDIKPKAYSLKIPVALSLRYSSKGIIKDKDGEKIRTFSCNKGEVFMESTKAAQNADNFYGIFNALLLARLTNVKYEEMVDIILQGSRVNGINLGVNRTLLEAFVSEMARSEIEENVPFRVHYGDGSVGKDGFKFMKLKDVPRVNSPFTSVNFEDAMTSIQKAVHQTIKKKPQKVSPIEQVMKY